MVDFPDNPAIGDELDVNNVAYMWDGVKWLPLGTPGSGGVQYLPLFGGTMTGPITLAADPTSALETTTKQYVDAGDTAKVSDAPNDGALYARQSLAWAAIPDITDAGIPEAPYDGISYGRTNEDWSPVLPIAGGTLTGTLVLAADPVNLLEAATKQYVDDNDETSTFPEAPEDGQQYARQNADWTPIVTGESGDAPSDGLAYGRKDAAWSSVLPLTGGILSNGLGFGSTTVILTNDLTRHINLYGGQFGFNVTDGQLNLVANGQAVASLTEAGITMPVGTDVTLSKDPTSPMQAATKQYVDSEFTGTYLPIEGGTLTGLLTLSGDPTYPLHATTKQYVDFKFLPLAGGALTGDLLLPNLPTIPQHAINKDYADISYLAKAGGILVGDLILYPPTGQANIRMKTAAVANHSIISYVNNLPRWDIRLGNNEVESSNNVGSNFAIDAYDDTGNYLFSPLTIARGSGAAIFSKTLHVTQTTTLGAPLKTTYGDNCICCSVGNQYLTINGGYAFSFGGNFILNGGGRTTYAFEYYWGSARIGFLDTTGNFFISGNTAWKTGGGSWTDSSDERIKNVSGDYTLGLAEINQLRPVTYTYKGNDTLTRELDNVAPADEGKNRYSGSAPYPASPHAEVAKSNKEFVGLIAQELETIFPGMVTKRAGFIDGQPVTDLRDIDTSAMIFALINAVKELSAKVAALESDTRR